MKIKTIAVFSLTLLLILILIISIFPRFRSLVIMKIRDFYYNLGSVPNENTTSLELPIKNMDYYPFLISFNSSEGISNYLKKDVNLTIEFAFADFKNKRSQIYNEDSPLYNSYIGVYYLKGFNKELDENTAYNLVKYDITRLALPAFGLSPSDSTFDMQGEIQKSKEEVANIIWKKYKSKVIVNGPEHVREEFLLSYLQYGSPPEVEQSYPIRKMHGLLYVTYIEDEDINICIFATAKTDRILEEIENKIIKHAKFKNK